MRWDKVDRAKYYDLRSYTVARGWQRLGGENLTGTTFSHTGLTAGTTYYYWVRGIRGPGNVSPWSTRMHATVPLPQSPTPTPTTTPTCSPACSPDCNPDRNANANAGCFANYYANRNANRNTGLRPSISIRKKRRHQRCRGRRRHQAHLDSSSRRNPLQHLLLPIR